MITVRDFKQKNDTKTNKEDEVIKQKAATVDDSKNKFSVIHVVSATQQTVAMVPFRKCTILKHVAPTKDKTPRPLPVLAPAVEGTGNGQVYQQRKRMLPEYKELFAALMKLPDKEMQNKLLAVINSHHSPREYRTIETQTDPVEIKDLLSKETEEISIRETANGSGNETPNSKDSNASEEMVKKRKRKRKVSLPQANKESRAKQLAKMNKPKTSMMNNDAAKPSAPNGQQLNSPKRQRIDSFSISECSSDIVNIFDDHQTNVIMEFNKLNEPFENGLLPIQDGVVKNQTYKLSLHIPIWQTYIGTDLNDILTEEDEDLLQLAVINMCDPSIISLLLEKGLNPNTFDAESNTIVHLAILNDITVKSLEHLMNKIELKLLLTLNDEGYTPLHLAIRQDRFLLAECMLNILDERLMKKVFYKRQLDELETDEKVLKKQFHNYYEKICLRMALDDETNTSIIDNHDLKQKLLQAGDRRSGNTVLYFAIDNRYGEQELQ
ncbi:hypothetical protein FF38_06651 [Lucilia cuprina]|uniref:Uncharacterized protein n=1 Tax=Lucilia cuprina TaxID=7375 RepID=A0A0L0CHY5_LUCCU|nr:hypothetical protein FF38_06651 [Lucilia cuprina]